MYSNPRSKPYIGEKEKKPDLKQTQIEHINENHPIIATYFEQT